MPGPMTIARGNQLVDTAIGAVLTPPNLPASSTVSVNYTIIGLQPLDLITVYPQVYLAGVEVGYAFVSAINTLTLSWVNDTVAAINGTPAQNLIIEVIRLENANLGFAMLPTQLV